MNLVNLSMQITVQQQNSFQRITYEKLSRRSDAKHMNSKHTITIWL